MAVITRLSSNLPSYDQDLQVLIEELKQEMQSLSPGDTDQYALLMPSIWVAKLLLQRKAILLPEAREKFEEFLQVINVQAPTCIHI